MIHDLLQNSPFRRFLSRFRFSRSEDRIHLNDILADDDNYSRTNADYIIPVGDANRRRLIELERQEATGMHCERCGNRIDYYPWRFNQEKYICSICEKEIVSNAAQSKLYRSVEIPSYRLSEEQDRTQRILDRINSCF